MPRTSSDLPHPTARTSVLRALSAAGGAVALAVTVAACSVGGHGSSSTPSESSQSSAAQEPDTSSGPSAPTASAAVIPDPAAVAAAASSVSAEHDDADVLFAQQMTVHHQGAVAMAMLAEDRASDPAVRDLAARIQAAQTPEIAQMTGWLQAWGASETTAEGGSTGEHGGSDMDSMGMSAQDTAALEAASGSEFDRLFLEKMTAHHLGAVGMARTEQIEGVNPQAVELAGAVVTSQTAEVQEMDLLLQTLQD